MVKVFSIFLLISIHCVGQKLVPNHNFSDVSECPYDVGQIGFATPWSTPNGKTTDLVHACTNEPLVSIPENKWGIQQPFSGNGMAGIRTYLHPSDLRPKYREYAIVKLIDTLDAGESYYASFMASPGEKLRYYSEDVALHFSKDLPRTGSFFELEPNIPNTNGFLNNFNAWYDISGEYLAKGGEQYIIIGNFKNDENTTLVDQFDSEGKFPSVYYFIDHVVVIHFGPIRS